MDMAADVLQPQGEDTARISWNLRKKIAEYQETFSVIEKVRRPGDGSVPHSEEPGEPFQTVKEERRTFSLLSSTQVEFEMI